MPRFSPSLQLTVPRDLWDAVADQASGDFADSYLSGAVVQGGRLLPKTQTAWDRIRQNPNAMNALRRQNVDLVKPPMFGDAASSF